MASGEDLNLEAEANNNEMKSLENAVDEISLQEDQFRSITNSFMFTPPSPDRNANEKFVLFARSKISIQYQLDGHDLTECSLFDPSLIAQLVSKHPHLALSDPELCVRPLRVGDFSRGYLDLLKQLTTVGDIDKDAFMARFSTMQTTPPSYYIIVIEHIPSSVVCASASLIVEWKFIHSTGFRTRVEDVVVSPEFRGKGLGKSLLNYLVALSKSLGAYKISLECKDKLIGWYEVFGFKKDEGNNFMVQRCE